MLTNASLFATDTPDVVVLAAAPSLTRPGAIVLRLQEVAGRKHHTLVTLPTAGLEVTPIDLAEAAVGASGLSTKGNTVEIDVPANATVSLLLSPKRK